MKAILLSIKPKYVVKILNGKKTIEVRKRFPKDYKGWVYIYCTKDSKMNFVKECWTNSYTNFAKEVEIGNSTLLNGKVVAKFTLKEVEFVFKEYHEHYHNFKTVSLSNGSLLEKSCTTNDELHIYFANRKEDIVVGYAIHISNLEIFDKPKELGEFKHLVKYHCNNCPYSKCVGHYMCMVCEEYVSLTKAPQSWCYVEVKE